MKIKPNILDLETELDLLLKKFKSLIQVKKHISPNKLNSIKMNWSIWCHINVAQEGQYFIYFNLPGDGLKGCIHYISDLLNNKKSARELAEMYLESYEWNKNRY